MNRYLQHLLRRVHGSAEPSSGVPHALTTSAAESSLRSADGHRCPRPQGQRRDTAEH